MRVKLTIETKTGIIKPNRTILKVRNIFIDKERYKAMLNDIDRAITNHARIKFKF